MAITLHKGDLPNDVVFEKSVAIDTETMGLQPARDRLCLVQLSSGDGSAHLVQIEKDNYDAPNLKALLTDKKVLKIFHFARFDLAVLKAYLGVECAPTYCTKIASKLTRTFTDRHGLREICKELLAVEINKQQQTSYWGAKDLTQEQLVYAASDVLHLHAIKEKLDAMLERENRTDLAQQCFNFLPTRVELDLRGWSEADIFEH